MRMVYGRSCVDNSVRRNNAMLILICWNNGATTQNLTSLPQGGYTVTVTDNNSCKTTYTDSVNAPFAVSIAGLSACSATSGAATATGSGGTWPYTYRWNTGATTTSLSTLSSGTYSVTAIDATGATATNSVVIANVTLSATISPAGATICSGNSVQLTGSGATSYSWSPSTGLSNAGIANPIANPTATTTYTLAANQVTGNLVTNGDFRLGNTGFTSGYGYISPAANIAASNFGLGPEGYYAVDTNANNYHSPNWICHDNTTGHGNFMIINGAPVADA